MKKKNTIMDYQRFESILAASPLPRPSSSAGRVHPVDPDRTPQDSDDNEYDQPHQPPPFRRSHSMRSSFTSLRSLKTRLKHPTAAAKYGPLSSPGRECSHQHQPQHQQQHQHQHTFTTAAAAAAKANLKTKLLKLRETYAEFKRLQSSSSSSSSDSAKAHTKFDTECWVNFKIPDSIPPKAAALLLEGPARRKVQRSQSLRPSERTNLEPKYATTIGGRTTEATATTCQSGKLTVRKVSLQSEAMPTIPKPSDGTQHNLTIARTATIRKSSVWANSSSSNKELFVFDFFLWDLSTKERKPVSRCS
ncbi:uncharacterized protein LOC131434893 [Malaya genurostris]|uniref:uncharacterized protein LOC131434893 n=1 Tax=Malaya genurostris TaxID=325434 RepID=UPI0026F3E9E9|nr:uncharacterized protein LOC131434893 [Malaya genurostris]